MSTDGFDETCSVSVELVEGTLRMPPLDGRYSVVLEANTWRFTKEAVVGRFIERSVYLTTGKAWNVLIPWSCIRSVVQPQEERTE